MTHVNANFPRDCAPVFLLAITVLGCDPGVPVDANSTDVPEAMVSHESNADGTSADDSNDASQDDADGSKTMDTPDSGEDIDTAKQGCGDPAEPNDDQAHATSLPTGANYAGQLCGKGDVDTYAITAGEGGWVEPSAILFTPGVFVRMELFDVDAETRLDGASWSTPAGDSNQEDVYAEDLVVGETYYIRLRATSGDGEPAYYSLTFDHSGPSEPCVDPHEPNDELQSATPLSVGRGVTGRGCSGDPRDIYALELEDDERFEVFLNVPASFDAGTLALLDKSGQTVNEISVDGEKSPHTMQIDNATGSIAFVRFEFESSPGHIFYQIGVASQRSTADPGFR